MASLGFRPPQFSEDYVWLPTWLQNSQVEASANSIMELKSNFSQVETLSKEVGRYNSCHLFLSGEDTSENIVAPSPGNVLHLCLHLSSDGESPYSQSQDIYISKPLHSSSKVLSTLANSQERLSPLKAYNKHHDSVKVLPSSPMAVENVHPQSPTNNDEIERHCGNHNGAVLINSALPAVENGNPSSPTNCKDSRLHVEKFNVRRIKDSDFSDAVELSIAASEALVIHELLRTESTPEIVPTGTILEAALQVKQARLEAAEDGICCSSHEIYEAESLSDLDDQIMENAFIDVGLFFTDLDNERAYHLEASQVDDTPVFEDHYEHNNGSKHVQCMNQQDKISNGAVLGLNNCNVAICVDPISDQSVERISHVSAVVQPQIDVSSYPACISENSEGEDGVCSLASDRFRSRWLGGWGVKVADVSTNMKQKSTKGIPKFFQCETSFLSESAGLAADENSFVKKHETGSKIASQSSIPFGGVLDKADEVNFISQEVRSSNQSLVDPLCSVVPCSITAETADFPLVENQDDKEADAQKSFSTKSELVMENFQKVLDLNIESGPVNREALPMVTGESFEAAVQRQLDSLKIFSTLLPKHDMILSGQRIFQNQHLSSEYVAELLSSNPYGHCHSGSKKKNSKWLLNLRSEFEYSNGRKHGQNQATVFRSPGVHRDDPSKDGAAEVQFQPSVQRKSPCILNRRAHCHLQPSEFLVEHFAHEKTSEQVVAQGTLSNALHNKNPQEIKSKLKNLRSAPNLVRKRVHFTEVELELQQNKDIQKPPTSLRNCSAIKANKRSKYCKLQSNSRTQDVKNCYTDHINDKKILIFHSLDFLLTGFSSRKEREIVRLINEYGGMVLSDIPSPLSNSRARRSARSNFHRLPIIISSKKLQTTKFLYGCAVNAVILKVKWVADSVAEGSLMPPEKYMILPNRDGPQYTRFGKSGHHDFSRLIFYRVGIILHGKHGFCTKLTIIIKHGGGQVFKTLQRLFQSLDTENISVGAIIAEDESKVSRHLRHCASEGKLPLMPASWVAKSLHFGSLLPFREREGILKTRAPQSATSLDWSEEI